MRRNYGIPLYTPAEWRESLYPPERKYPGWARVLGVVLFCAGFWGVVGWMVWEATK